jgi:hypothetical protein
MCSKCFHASNHEGHDVKIWISKGAGGCCDCGDPEAWKIPLQCTIHCLAESVHASPELSTEPLSSVPPPLMDSIRETIAVVFDYMMETFATSPEELFTIGSVQDIRQECIDSHDALGLPYDGEEQLYACVLWNDEKHSFDEVITVVQTAIGCTEEEADNAAKRVDLYGRFVLKVSKNIDELIMAAKTVNHIGLAVTVCSVQKTIREDISGLLLDWLKDLISGRYRFFSNVTAGNCIIRDSICQVLAAEWALTPDLAWLSTRYRRHRMNDDEDDDFHDEDSSSDDGVTEMAAFAAFGGDHDDGLVDFEDDIMLEDDEDDDDDEEDDDLEEEAVESSGDEEYEDAAEDMQIEQTSDEHDVETRSHFIAPVLDADSPERSSDALKRRRLSGSSQPTSNKTYRMRDILDIDWDLDGWLAHVEKLEKSEREIVKDFGIPVQADSSSVQINHQLKKEFRKKIRLDYLLQFDLRLWKTARVNIKDLLIGTFVSNFDYRPIIGTRFVRNYPELVDAFFFKDREPENSISTLSVQLLTVPTVASMLVKDFKFFSIVCSILSNFFLTDHMYMILPEMYENAQVNCSSRAISRHRYVYTFFDLRYIMNTDQVKLEIADNPLYLGHFINLIFQFQAMDPLRRKVNTHVEYESNSWVNAFNMTLQISKLCRQFAGCYDFGQPEGSVSEVEASRNLCRAIYRILKAIVDWNPHLLKNDKPDRSTIIKGIAHQNFHTVTSSVAGSYQIVDYNVSSDYTSFHHPYHWLLSELFENIHLLNDNLLNQLGWVGGFKQMVHEAFSTKEHAMFLMVLEYPIRTLTMLSQINCGVWVRNGFSIRNQVRVH